MPRYDLSYFQNPQLPLVLQRKKAIANALGSIMKRKLRVVQAEGGYALIYPRKGDAQSVQATAAAHTKILQPRNLGIPIPIASRDWTQVQGQAKPKIEAAEVQPKVETPAAQTAAAKTSASAESAIAPAKADAPSALAAAQTAAAAPAATKSPLTPAAADHGPADISSDEPASGATAHAVQPAAKSAEPVQASAAPALAATPTPAATAPAAAVAAAAPAPAAMSAERLRLESLVDEHLKRLRRLGRIAADELTAWYVYDFTTGEKLMEINSDIKLQAASLIKPFLALGFMHEVRAGRLVYDAESRRHMERMIQHSSNISTNWVMKKLGGPTAVQELLHSNYGEILQDMEIIEYIPPGGRTYKNKASVRDYSRFLLALWKDQLPESVEIKRLMALPKRDRLLTGTSLPSDTEVYGKTGSTSHLCGDMGVLSAKGPDGKQYAYTVIGIIEKKSPARHYRRWLRSRGNIIRDISSLVYQTVASIHGF
ncbi:MAG: serine hydrolase [Elusimicrobiota bacterium]|jgi:beta-lactamase class A